MTKMLQVRHVPDELHRTLKSRAALAGMSLSDYVLRELRQLTERPTREEFLRRLASREPVTPTVSPVEILAEERDRR